MVTVGDSAAVHKWSKSNRSDSTQLNRPSLQVLSWNISSLHVLIELTNLLDGKIVQSMFTHFHWTTDEIQRDLRSLRSFHVVRRS